MRFISHLDLVRLFQRTSRRANLPVVMSQGFSPRLKISITRALKLGLEGMDQEAVFCIEKLISPEEFMGSMNTSLPDGVKITRVEEMV
jgi:radical SAM-linked protein